MKRYANQTDNTPIVQAALPLLCMAALPMNSSKFQLPSLIIKSNGKTIWFKNHQIYVLCRTTIPKSKVCKIGLEYSVCFEAEI